MFDASVFTASRWLLTLLILNVTSFAAGVLLIVAGFFLEGQRHMVFDIYSDTFSLALFLLMMVGITFCLLSVDMTFYRGSLRENSCQVMAMAFVVMLICTLELAAFLSGTILRAEVEQRTRETLFSKLDFYNQSAIIFPDDGVPNEKFHKHHLESSEFVTKPAGRNYWDLLQQWLKCCGVDSSADWSRVLPKKNVPDSCCLVEKSGCGVGARNNSAIIFEEGCILTFQKWMRTDVYIFSLVSGGFCFIQIAGMVAQFYLKRKMASKRLVEAG